MHTVIKEMLVNKGFRVTNARVAVLHVLQNQNVPLDVIDIVEELAKKQIKADQVTIYRMLDAFVGEKLVTRLDFHEGKFRYELVKDDHHHLICQKCGTVCDISDCPVTDLEENILKKQKFLVKQHSLEFFGLCALCQ